jgi:hypothetical protein
VTLSDPRCGACRYRAAGEGFPAAALLVLASTSIRCVSLRAERDIHRVMQLLGQEPKPTHPALASLKGTKTAGKPSRHRTQERIGATERWG